MAAWVSTITSSDERLRERAAIFVESWAKVQPAERVLVLADETAEPAVVRAVVDWPRARGGDGRPARLGDEPARDANARDGASAGAS